MKKTIWNIVIMIVCLIAIICWLYFRIYNGGIEEEKEKEESEEETPVDEEIPEEEVKDKEIIEEIINTTIESKEESEEETPVAENIPEEEVKDKEIIEEIINTTIENQEEEEEEEEEEIIEKIGEITYTLVEGETFREATIKLKAELKKGGYDYNKVKQEHVFFIIDNRKTKLNWNTAVKRYLDKKQPKDGDYFFMKKFPY